MIAPDPSLATASRVRVLPNNVRIVSTLAGNIMVNSPPETLKYLLAHGIETPKIILLPPDVRPGQELGSSGFVRQGINYASVEFLMYANFFGGGGQRTQMITVTEHQAQRLYRILEETVSGPKDPEAYGSYGWLQQECSAIGHYPPLGRSLHAEDLVDITSLEQGGGKLAEVEIRLEDEEFLFFENEIEVARVSTRMSQKPMPLALAPAQPVQRQELTLQFVGASNGFDPVGITTCFLAYLSPSVHTQATLFETAAYLHVRLGNLGLSPNQISEVVLSHLHEDHLAGLPELILMGMQRVQLVTADLIYQSLLRVLGAMLGVPEVEVAALFDHYPLNPGQPLELGGRRFEAIYALHSIPTIAVRVGGICYSGDMRYDEEWFADLEARGVITAERRAELISFADGASILVQDVGGGPTHSTLTPALLRALASKSQRVILAHTSKHEMPTDQPELLARVEFADSGHVVSMGQAIASSDDVEPVETLSASPLFARLPIKERLRLLKTMDLATWQDGELIGREGDPSDGYAYIVHSGLVEIWTGGERMRVLGRGSCFGERGALQSLPRAGTMVARGEVQLLRLSADVLRPLSDYLGLQEAFARADWLWTQPAFGHLPWATLLDLALDFEPRELQPGEELFRAGEAADQVYLLIAGTVSVVDQAGEPVKLLHGPGAFCGVHTALHGTLHETSAYAQQQCQAWVLPASALRRLHMVYPNVLLHLRLVG